MVGVHHIIHKTVSIQLSIQTDGFVAHQSHRGGTMLTVSTCVRQGIYIDGADMAILCGAQPDLYLHLMTGGGSSLRLKTGKDHF